MKLKKVCVMGHFGFGETLLNGQTVKTKIVTSQLDESFGEQEVYKVDTRGGIKTLILLPFILFAALKKCENIIILPAQNGVRIIAPLLSLINVFFKRSLHYVVIGGWLSDLVKNKPILRNALKKFSGIYVETKTMKSAIEEFGIKNVKVMPNCKPLQILEEDQLVYSLDEPYKLCTFSRVMKEKGIADAVEAVKSINEKYGKAVYSLDIYGQIDQDQTEWFESLKAEFPEYVSYGGLVPFDKSVEVLKNYFALLFPTYYEGEGFAGTIIDAFAAGIPVVASDWRYNPEIVDDGVCGAIVRSKDCQDLAKKLEQLYLDPQKWNMLKTNCIKTAKNYLPEEVIKVIDIK